VGPGICSRGIGSAISNYHVFTGSEQKITDLIAEQLENELQKRDVLTGLETSKSIEIKVIGFKYEEGDYTIRTFVEFLTKLGNGKEREFRVEGGAGRLYLNIGVPNNVNRLYNHAISIAVTEILNDTAFQEYLLE